MNGGRGWLPSTVIVSLLVAGLLPAAVPAGASSPSYCDAATVQAQDLPARVYLEDCDLVGRTVAAQGLRLRVPPPGEGRSVVGVTMAGEASLEVSTSADGVVEVHVEERTTDHDASQERPGGSYAAAFEAGADNFSGAAPLAVPDSFLPTTGQTFDLAAATLETGEPAAGCDSSAVGSLWYRIRRPGTLRRIKLHADVALAVYRGTALGSLQRVRCIGALEPARLLKLAPTGTYYVQVAVTEADATSKPAAHVTLTNGEMRPDGAPPCDVRAHALIDSITPRKPLKWRFKAASVPPTLARRQALRGIKRGMNIVTGSKNDCGLNDTVSARHTYLGRTRKQATLCTRGRIDGVNTVAFGPAPVGMLGLACSAWTISANGKRHVFESDMRLSSGVPWTMKPDAPGCVGGVDLVGVATHEAGHVFGLDHAVGTKALNQTMSVSQSSCSGAFRTLGRGDVVALRKLY